MNTQLRAVPDERKRVPPNDIEAERAVLSAILLDGSVLDRVAHIIRPEHFFGEPNRRLFEACLAVRDKGKPIDVVTVRGVLADHGRLAQVGGVEYIGKIVDETPAVANVEAHALIVLEKARVRSLIAQCQKLAALGYGNEDPTKFIERVKREIDEICAKDDVGSGRLIGPAVSEMYQHLIARGASKLGMGLPTGYLEIDEITSGLHPGEVTYIAARPGMGKTSFALGIALNVATGAIDLFNRDDKPKDAVAIFSIEMPEDQVALRMTCIQGGVDSQRLRKDKLTDAEWATFVKVCDHVSTMPIWIDDRALDLVRLRGEIDRVKGVFEARGQTLRLAVIDYIGLMDGPGKNEYELITENSKGLKRLAKEAKIPLVVLCQLSRKSEERSDKRPDMVDLRGSGALEQDADNIWFIYRQDYYLDPDGDGDVAPTGEAEIIIAKQRNGPAPRKARLRYYEGCTRFDNA